MAITGLKIDWHDEDSVNDLRRYLTCYRFHRPEGMAFPPFHMWRVSPRKMDESSLRSYDEMDYEHRLEDMTDSELEAVYNDVREAEDYRAQHDEAAFAKAAVAIRQEPSPVASDSAVSSAGEQLLLLLEKIRALEAVIQNLENELDASQTREEKLSAEAKKQEPLNPRERPTAYRLVLGLARIAYKYDPRKRSSVPNELSNDLLAIRISVSDDTVRSWLNRAYQDIGSELLLSDG